MLRPYHQRAIARQPAAEEDAGESPLCRPTLHEQIVGAEFGKNALLRRRRGVCNGSAHLCERDGRISVTELVTTALAIK